jgi:organic radical activating enzyme
MSYSPEGIVLTLSRQCNLQCSHCVVEAGPKEKGTLQPAVINQVLDQANAVGITGAVIYGGEPFIHSKNLLPFTLRSVLRREMSVIIATNGFWGRTDEQAQRILAEVEAIAKPFNQKVYLGLSFDQYHQPAVPSQSIANIITQFRLGQFPHILLTAQTFKEDASEEIVEDIFTTSHRKGIILMESNNLEYWYPALREELIEFCPENFPRLSSKLGLPEGASEKEILASIYHKLRLSQVIARDFDYGEGQKKYTVFPDPRYGIEFTVTPRVIKAGRARTNGKLELALPDDMIDPEQSLDFLVISPNGEAYAYPAQMTAERGVRVWNKPLAQVIREVEENIGGRNISYLPKPYSI